MPDSTDAVTKEAITSLSVNQTDSVVEMLYTTPPKHNAHYRLYTCLSFGRIKAKVVKITTPIATIVRTTLSNASNTTFFHSTSGHQSLMIFVVSPEIFRNYKTTKKKKKICRSFNETIDNYADRKKNNCCKNLYSPLGNFTRTESSLYTVKALKALYVSHNIACPHKSSHSINTSRETGAV